MPDFIPALDPALPLVMLPLRLETRYFAVSATDVELRVRFFPSAAHVTSDRSGVDPAERDETIAYWRQRRELGDEHPDVVRSWNQLTRQYGEPRMRYLRALLTPSPTMDFPDVPLNEPDTGALNSEAQALPSSIVLSGYIGTERAFAQEGLPIAGAVLCGPHGEDDALRWQWNFADAEARGLALRVALKREIAERLTHLTAIGVRTAGPQEGANQVRALVERWSRGDGAALLEAGTPTNNTEDERVTRPVGAPEAAPAAGTDGIRLATALGIDPLSFAQVSHSDRRADQQVAALHQAVWPATLRYFLREVMAPVFNDAGVERAHDLFVHHVRARGPYPSLLLGAQPFGILPISASARWKADGGGSDRLVQGLTGLKARWLEAARQVPLLNFTDPVASLNAVLSAQPFSTRVLARTVESRDIASRFFADRLGVRFTAAADGLRDAVAKAELEPVGIAEHPLALDQVLADQPYNLRMPLVAPASEPTDQPLGHNYISAMIRPNLDDLRNHAIPGATRRSALYYLLRASTLQVAGGIAGSFHGRLEDRAFVSTGSTTVYSQLERPVAALNGRAINEILRGDLPPMAAFEAARAHRAALTALAPLSVGALTQITSEALDACSFRLDAWFTATSSERLAHMRSGQPEGAHLGAYAWLEAPPLSVTIPAATDSSPMDGDSNGFVHAPSLDHARTAAVLRAAYLERRDRSAQAPLSIDLGSTRVRTARQLLAGVCAGQSLSVLLGMRLESWLLELNLAAELADLHASGPLVENGGRQWVDGAALVEMWSAQMPTSPGLQKAAVRLIDLVDACGDLLRAEATHHQLAGRPARAQAALEALYSGLNMPTEFDVVRTPETGRTTTWRLVLPIDPAELADWIETMLGEVGRLGAEVEKADGSREAVTVGSVELEPGQPVTANTLFDLAKSGDPGSALFRLIAEQHGIAPSAVIFSPALEDALWLATILARLLGNARSLSPEETGTERTDLNDYALPSQRTEWLHDLARVKPSVAALEALGEATQPLDLRFTQIAPGVNQVSLGPLRADGAGMLIDGWNETVPGLETTTGLAFHFDAPKARAAQAILLMVPPEPGKSWDFDTVEAIMFEFADVLKMRMVRPAHVAGTLLPALYFADNIADDVISTDFLSLAVRFEMVAR